MPTPARRIVLGERTDNIFMPPLPAARGKATPAPGGKKAARRDSLVLVIAPDKDDSMLFDERPPSSVAGLTDTETEGEQEKTPAATKPRGKAVLRPGRMATPEASQQVDTSPSQTPTARAFPSKPVSLATPQRSQLSRIRPRPSPTPPRRDSVALSAAHIASAEPSPNPRQKKNPRLSGSRSPAESSFSIELEPKTSHGKKRASLESQSSGSGKSRDRTSPSALASSSTQQTRAGSVEPSRRKSTSPSQTSVKPAKPRKSAAATRKSLAAETSPKSRQRRRQTLTPALLSKMVGHKVRIGDFKVPLSSQGDDDPLLLVPSIRDRRVTQLADEDDFDGGSQGTVRGKGKGRAGTPNRIVKSFPFKPYDPNDVKPFEREGSLLSLPKTVRRKGVRQTPMHSQMTQDEDDLDGYGQEGFASDSGDEGGIYNDTFVDLRARRSDPSTGRFMMLDGQQEEEAEIDLEDGEDILPTRWPVHNATYRADTPPPAAVDMPASSPAVRLHPVMTAQSAHYALSESEAEEDDADVIYPWTATARSTPPATRTDVPPTNPDESADTTLLATEEADATVGEIEDTSFSSAVSAGTGDELSNESEAHLATAAAATRMSLDQVDMPAVTPENKDDSSHSLADLAVPQVAAVQSADEEETTEVFSPDSDTPLRGDDAKGNVTMELEEADSFESLEETEQDIDVSVGAATLHVPETASDLSGDNREDDCNESKDAQTVGDVSPQADEAVVAPLKEAEEASDDRDMDELRTGQSERSQSFRTSPKPRENSAPSEQSETESESDVTFEQADTTVEMEQDDSFEHLASNAHQDPTPAALPAEHSGATTAADIELAAQISAEVKDGAGDKTVDTWIGSIEEKASTDSMVVPSEVSHVVAESAEFVEESFTPSRLTPHIDLADAVPPAEIEQNGANDTALPFTSAPASSTQSPVSSPVNTPIIHRLRRSLNAGSTPFGKPSSRPAQQRTSDDQYDGADEEAADEEEGNTESPLKAIAIGTARDPLLQSNEHAQPAAATAEIAPITKNVASSSRHTATADSLYVRAAWQGLRPSDTEDEGHPTKASRGLRTDAEAVETTDVDDEVIEREWAALLRKSGCGEWNKPADAYEAHKAEVEDGQVEGEETTEQESAGHKDQLVEVPAPIQEEAQTFDHEAPMEPELHAPDDLVGEPSAPPSPAESDAPVSRASSPAPASPSLARRLYPALAARILSPALRRVASFEERARSASISNPSETDSYFADITAETVDAELSDSDSEVDEAAQVQGADEQAIPDARARDEVKEEDQIGANGVVDEQVGSSAADSQVASTTPVMPSVELSSLSAIASADGAPLAAGGERTAAEPTQPLADGDAVFSIDTGNVTDSADDSNMAPVSSKSTIEMAVPNVDAIASWSRDAEQNVENDTSVITTTPLFSPKCLPTLLSVLEEGPRHQSPEPSTEATLQDAPPVRETFDGTSTEQESSGLSKSTDDQIPATAVRPEGKIVLKLIPSGVVKIEPEDETNGAASHAVTTPKAPKQAVASTTPTSTPPRLSILSANDESLIKESPSKVRNSTKANEAVPTHAEPDFDRRMVGTVTEDPPIELGTSASSLDVMRSHLPPTPPATASPISATNSLLFAQANKPHAPSRLSHLITGDTPASSPVRPVTLHDGDETLEEAHEEADEDETADQEDDTDRDDARLGAHATSAEVHPGLNISVASTMSRRSKLRELIDAEGPNAAESLKDVVEVSSLDPMAAARAAAILKMNYNYIEHGILDVSQRCRRNVGPSTPGPSNRSLNPDEFLYQAELEITDQLPGLDSPAARHVREGTAFSIMSASTNLPIPGGWVRTPVIKRKREMIAEEPEPKAEPNADAWAVQDWKRLEKVFRQEKEAWLSERETKPLPAGGFMSWARRSLSRSQTPSQPTEQPWELKRVVDTFTEAEKRQGRDWDLGRLELRVQVLEQRVDDKISRSQMKVVEETSPTKKAKSAAGAPVVNTPAPPAARTAVPPSSVRRVMNWVWGAKDSENVEHARPSADEAQLGHRHMARQSMTQVDYRPPTSRQPADTPTRVMERSTYDDTALGSSMLGLSTSSSATSLTIPLDTPVLPSRLYPSLQPPISQRSTAIKSLFPAIHPLGESSASASSSSRLAGSGAGYREVVKRSSSVKDMVKGFEKSGQLGDLLNSRRG